jgi:biotin operon repressor
MMNTILPDSPHGNRTHPFVPAAPSVDFAALPDALRDREQWVAWRYVRHGAHWSKPPITADTGKHADPTVPSTWRSLSVAFAYYRTHRPRISGVGFVFHPRDPFTGIDLDDCRDPDTGLIESWAEVIIRDIASYAEVSPSGTGVKLIARAALPDRGMRAPNGEGTTGGQIEFSERDRDFTLTGARLPLSPPDVRDAQGAVDALYERLREEHAPRPSPRGRGHDATPTPAATPTPSARPRLVLRPISDLALPNGHALWARFSARLDPRILACAEGVPVPNPDGAQYPSPSEADQSLMFALIHRGLSNEEAIACFLATPRGDMLRRRKGGDIQARLWRSAEKVRTFYIPPTAGAFLTSSGIPVARLDPAFLVVSRSLGPYGVAVMTIIASHADGAGEAFPSQDRIQRLLDCSDDKVRDRIKVLRAHGIMTLARKRGEQHVHRLVYTDAPPIHLRQSAIVAMHGAGVDVVAAYTMVASLPIPSAQGDLSERLAIPRSRVSVGLRWLRDHDLVHVTTGARGAKRYSILPSPTNLPPQFSEYGT